MTKNKSIAIYGGIISLIVILSLSALFMFKQPQEAFVSTSCKATATILAVSANDISLNFDTATPHLRLLVTPNNQGECAQLKFSASDIMTVKSKLRQQGYDLTPQGQTNLQNMILDVKLITQEKIFTAREDKTKIVVAIQKIQVDNYISLLDKFLFSTQKCKDLTTQGKLPGTTLASGIETFFSLSNPADFFCHQQIQYGTLGDFIEQSSINTVTKFYLNGEDIGTLTSNNIAFVKDNKDLGVSKAGKLSVKYVGSLVSPQGFDLDTPHFDTFFQQNQFIMIDNDASNILYTSYLNLLSCVKGRPIASGYQSPTSSEIQKCVDTYNAVVNKYTGIDKSSIFKTSNPIIKQIFFENDKLHVDISDAPLTFPIFTIDTTADFVTIIKLSGTPSITTCQSSFELKSQDSKDVSFVVKNIGNYKSSFSPSLSCNGVEQSLNQGVTVVDSLSSYTYKGVVNLASEDDITSKCTFDIEDINSGVTKSCNFNVNVVARKCQEGTTTCSLENDNDLLICSGGKWQVKETCNNGCSLNKCSGPEVTKPEICDNFIDDDLDGLVDVLDPECQGGGGKGTELLCNDGIDNDNDGAIDGEDSDCKGITQYCQNEVTLGEFTVLPDFGQRPRQGVEKITGLFSSDKEVGCIGIFATIAFLIGVIVFLITFIGGGVIVSNTLKEVTKSKGIRTLIGFIISAIIAFIIYMLILNLFVWGLIIGVIIGILILFKNKLKKMLGI